MIKAIFLDFDGTLYTHTDERILPSTIEAIVNAIRITELLNLIINVLTLLISLPIL